MSMSGTSFNPWAFQQKPVELAKGLAENVECSTEDPIEMVKCLRSKTPAQIVTGQMKFSVISKDEKYIRIGKFAQSSPLEYTLMMIYFS